MLKFIPTGHYPDKMQSSSTVIKNSKSSNEWKKTEGNIKQIFNMEHSSITYDLNVGGFKMSLEIAQRLPSSTTVST